MAVALLGTMLLFSVGWLVTGRRRDGVVPAAIVGGALGLGLRQVGLLPGSVEAWQAVGYHLFGISFLAIGLTRSDRRGVSRGALWLGAAQGMVFAAQATVGGLVVLVLDRSGVELFPAFGFLAPLGLEEGPGQAVSIGSLWESAGFLDAATLGATIASLGFVVAYLGGLAALVVRRRRRGPTQGLADRPSRVGQVPGRGSPATDSPVGAAKPQEVEPGPLAPSEDRTTAPLVLVGSAVGLVGTYVALYVVVGFLAGLAGPDVHDLALGVLFFLALLVGMGMRTAAGRLGWDIPAAPQRRLTLAAVDGLTVAILSSLAWNRIADRAGALALVLAATLLATVVLVVVVTGRVASRRFDRALALFGTVTGTVSSGLAVVSLSGRGADSPVVVELGASVVVSAPLVLAGVGLATATASGAVELGAATAIFAVVAATGGTLLYVLGSRL